MPPEDAVRVLMSPAAYTGQDLTLAKHTIGSCTLSEYNAALATTGANASFVELTKATRRSWRNTEYQKSARRKQAAVAHASLSNATDALHENMLDNLSNHGWRTDHAKWLKYGFISFTLD
jgi:hypothetical protein